MEFVEMIRDFHDFVVLNNKNLIKTEAESIRNVRNTKTKNFNNNNNN